ncbi:DUF998 domain-containing protein [Henriciella marina]|uniref:DUF998 domain-containing protein n=1 Tax=Henriciella marina TaxID=453851 RepID=A0ABT4LR51_9PROT|nr:DUF998 domain-containing protein [Henriciella marina]MCZ4296810.1 DUF998 domain-containing protein [Henriciella marina]
MDKSNRDIHMYTIAACLVAVTIDLSLAVFMDRQSLLTSTISDLAAGDFDLAQDIGLTLVAIAIALTALVIWKDANNDRRLKTAAILLAFAGPLIVLISLYEAYSKQDPDGPLIHYWVVGAIGLSISVALALIAWARSEAHPLFKWGTGLAAIIFLSAGTATFGVSNEIIGLVERFAAVALILWLLGFHGSRLVQTT